MRRLLHRNSPDWSTKGVYAFWDPDSRKLLYVGLASNLPQRFAQHNGLVAHTGGNKLEKINEWFSLHSQLGLTLLIQGAAVQILEDVQQVDPAIGVAGRRLTQVAEGQLIELHKREHGHWPPWNGVGGSIQGSEWAKPSERSVVSLLSAADESLFVARRTLRRLIDDDHALQWEALLHAVRMRALLELHEMDFSHDSDLQETIEKITRVLMLIDGKLIDNLSPADDRIRAWVKHFADSVGRSAERLDHLEQVRKISDATPDEADRAVAGLLAGFMSVDADAYNTRVAAGLLEQHYLDENPL